MDLSLRGEEGFRKVSTGQSTDISWVLVKFKL